MGLEHGRFDLARLGSVICIRAWDQWNEETAVHFARELRNAAEPLRGSRWAVLTDLRQWELGVPEMEPHMNELDLWCLRAGQKLEATVLPVEPVVRWQVEQMFADTQKLITREYFSDPAPACEWLATGGVMLDAKACLDFLAPPHRG